MKEKLLVIFFALTLVQILESQELQVLKVTDFDLKGAVKTCTVITDYGKELFEFNSDGVLTKTITYYNEEDQDITQYFFDKGLLVEKRMESYKGGVLDPMTSMANFYKYDTLGTIKKVNEQIVSYDKEFLEVQEYQFNEDGQVTKIIVSNREGVDEKRIEHSQFKNETTKSFFNNDILEKSVRISIKKTKTGEEITTILTKEFLDGQPTTAKEQKKYADGRLLSNQEFTYSVDKKQFVSLQLSSFFYNTDTVLDKEVIQRGNSVSEKGYIFQYDNHEPKNWVKKIVTPDNTYVTRKIEYFDNGMVDLKAD